MLRTAKPHHKLVLALGFLAVVGWGTAFATRVPAAARDRLQAEVVQLKATQDQLQAEQKRQLVRIEDLGRERDQARAQAESARQELAMARKGLGEVRAKSAGVSAGAAGLSSEPARTSAESRKQR